MVCPDILIGFSLPFELRAARIARQRQLRPGVGAPCLPQSLPALQLPGGLRFFEQPLWLKRLILSLVHPGLS